MSTNKEDQNRRERIRRVIGNRNNASSASRFDTSDIIQETEYQLWRNGIDSLESDYTCVDQALLATIARGNLARKLREHRRKKRNAACDSPITSPILGTDPDPGEIAEQQEITEKLLTVVSQLDEIDQRIYFLRFHCDATFAEIEVEVELTRRQLNTRFSKMKTHIRKALGTKRQP